MAGRKKQVNTNRIVGANKDDERRDDWETPDEIFQPLNNIFDFQLDAAGSEANTKCPRVLTEELNALNLNWWAFCIGAEIKPTIWLNPPYKGAGKWVKKAYEESIKGCTVVCLLPPSVDAKWYRDFVLPYAEIFWYAGRIKFVDPTGQKRKGPSKGNLLAIFRPPLPDCWLSTLKCVKLNQEGQIVE